MRFFIFSATRSINVNISIYTSINIRFSKASFTSLTLFFLFRVLVLSYLKYFKKVLQ